MVQIQTPQSIAQLEGAIANHASVPAQITLGHEHIDPETRNAINNLAKEAIHQVVGGDGDKYNIFPDGTRMVVNSNGDVSVQYPDPRIVAQENTLS